MTSLICEKLVNYNAHIDPYPEMYAFFNCAYDYKKFIEAIQFMAGRIDSGFDYSICNFPNWDDFDDEFHFEGVMFVGYDSKIIITEKEAFDGARMACELYLKRHPEDEVQVRELMKRFPA